MRNKTKGFTLTELMIVVVVISILIALGTPQYARSSQRVTARKMADGLSFVCVAQEQYKVNANSQTGTVNANQLDIKFQGATISGAVITLKGYSMTLLDSGKYVRGQNTKGTYRIYRSCNDSRAYCAAPSTNNEGKGICNSVSSGIISDHATIASQSGIPTTEFTGYTVYSMLQ